MSSHIGKFKEHQAAGTLALKFWPKLTGKFFKLWKSQNRELREWKMLKEMVENGMAVPSCLGGGDSDAAKKAGLDIKITTGEGEEGDDESDSDSENDAVPPEKELSDLSSDEEEVRAANEAALAGKGSIPAPDGASDPAQTKKKPKKKKKKQIVINVPERLKDNKTWMTTRTSQIQRWFYNATSKSRKAAPQVNIDFKGLFSSAVGGRALTESQMYSKLYYGTRVKDDVDAEVAERNLNKGERIALTAKRLQEAYEGETDEIKEKVRAEMAKAAREKEDAMEILKNMVESGGEREQTPAEYAKIQASLKSIIRCFFDMLGPMTGYAFCVLGGGPKSDNFNGAMGYVSYNRGWGESRNDFTFNRWYDDYHANLVKPFGDFCHELFPEEYRLQRAITITDTPTLSLDALRKSGRNFGKLQSGGPIVSEIERPSTTQVLKHNPKLPPVVKARDPMPAVATKKGKGAKTPVSLSEDDDTDDEESEPSDPSDHDAPRKRRKGGHVVLREPSKAKGRRAKKAVEASRDSNRDESEDEHDNEVDKAQGPKPKPTKGTKAKKPAEVSVESDEDDGGDEEDESEVPKAKRTKKRGARAKIVDDETGSGSEDEEQDKAVQEVKKKQEKKKAGGKGKAAKPTKLNGPKPRPIRKTKGQSHGGEGQAELVEGVVEQAVKEGEQAVIDELEPIEEAPMDDTHPGSHDPPIEPPSPRLPLLPTPAKRKSASIAPEDGGRQKRSRRQPRNVEDWVTATKTFLLGCVKSKAWEELVEAWYDFETLGYAKDSRVTEVNARPHELKRWLQARQGSMPRAYAPILEDVEDYKSRWTAWWCDLKAAGVTGGDTRVIRRAGPSGVVTILLGLAFWSSGQVRSAEWKEVVGELLRILKP